MTTSSDSAVVPVVSDERHPSLRDFRRSVLLKHLRLPCRALEIGPFLRPTLAPSEAPLKILDFYTTEELQKQAIALGHPVDEVLPVDCVCRDEAFAEVCTGQFDVVMAAHVVEHLIGFVEFFHTMRRMLSPDGILFIVLPDKRRSFDRVRPITPLSHFVYEHLRPDTQMEKSLHSLETEIYYDMSVSGRPNVVESRLNVDNLRRSLDRWHPGCHAHVFEFEHTVHHIIHPLCAMGLLDFDLVNATMSNPFGEFALVLRAGKSQRGWLLVRNFYSP